MALRLFFLASVFFAGTLASVNQLDLTGFVQGRVVQSCPPGEVCPPAPPLTGYHENIWHCDGSCTKVYLWCHLDHFQISIEPPPGGKETHVFALGGPGHLHVHRNEPERGPYRIRECDSGVYGPPAIAGQVRDDFQVQGRNPFPGTIHEVISFDRCGTVTEDEDVGGRSTFITRAHLNELDLVEYIPKVSAKGPEAAVHIVSHTRIRLKCCNGGGTSNDTCPPIESGHAELWECTEKSFQLTCTDNADDETYCCTVDLAPAQVLPADVGYYLESCNARDVTGNQATVSLLSNGTPSSNLQVQVGASSSQAQYSIGGPWFQFDRPSTDLNTHPVGVECTIKLVPRVQLANHRPNGNFCSAGARPRSDAGFFQAGDLSLVKNL